MSDVNRRGCSPSLGVAGSLSIGSSVSPEQERDYYREKVEHFKTLVRNLQDEIQNCKLRNEGTATISKLLQETKQELAALNKKNSTYESVIRNLQSRLEKHGLSSEIKLLENEQYLPGNSKKLIDNLTRENNRLRKVIRTDVGDPEEFARLQQAFDDIKQENNKLQTRIVELEEVLRASDNDKDRTITQLREELSHLNRELNARDVKCSSLAKEAEKLQKQLEDVAYQCHDLAKKLQEQTTLQTTKTTETLRKEEVPMDVNEDHAALTEEIRVLKLKVQEITDMNKRWQDYNKQREVYVAQLTRELNELHASSAQQATSNSKREFELQMNRVLDEARKNIEAAEREKNQVLAQLDAANRSILALNQELRQLKQRRPNESNPEATETIQALKAQIQICTEDFESERKDREKAQTKINRQESELLRLRKEVDDLRRQREYWQSSPQPQIQYADPFYHERLAPRGVTNRGRPIDMNSVIDGAKVRKSDELEKQDIMKDVPNNSDDSQQAPVTDSKNRTSDNEYHSLRTSSLSSNSNRASPTPSPRHSESSSPTQDIIKQNTRTTSECLKCPKCAKEYTGNEHGELLEHIEMCCE